MRKFHLLSLAILATLTATPALAAKAPHMPIATFNDLAQPLPKPYDEAADAKATDAAVAAARARAKKAGKLMLVDLGGNWCLDCRILAGVMETAPLRQWVAARYEIVTVDVGRFNKNLQVPARYGITDRLEGVPALLIVNPRTGKLVNAGRVTALADARSMSPQGLADWLAQWPAK